MDTWLLIAHLHHGPTCTLSCPDCPLSPLPTCAQSVNSCQTQPGFSRLAHITELVQIFEECRSVNHPVQLQVRSDEPSGPNVLYGRAVAEILRAYWAPTSKPRASKARGASAGLNGPGAPLLKTTCGRAGSTNSTSHNQCSVDL